MDRSNPTMTLRGGRTHAVFAILAAALLAGCSYSVGYMPDYVPKEAVAAPDKIDGKVLVYMDRGDVEYIYKGSPTTFTASATTLSIPIGIVTREVSRAAWSEYFRGGADAATSLERAKAYRAIVRPHVTQFSYAYHQLENLGFAITPGVKVTLDVSLVNENGVAQWSRTFDSGEVKAGSYMVSFKPEEKVNRLLHEIVADLNRKAAREAVTYLRAQPAGSPTMP